MKSKKLLALALALTTAFTTLAPNTGFLPISVVKAEAYAGELITSVKVDGRALDLAEGDVIMMGMNDEVSIEVAKAGSVKKVVVELIDNSGVISNDKTIKCVQNGNTATVTTTRAEAGRANLKLRITPYKDNNGEPAVVIPINIGKYKASYYFMTAVEYADAIKEGKTVEPDAEVYMVYDSASNPEKSILTKEQGLDMAKAIKPGYNGSSAAWQYTVGDGEAATLTTTANISKEQAEQGVRVFFAEGKPEPLSYDVIFDDNKNSLTSKGYDIGTVSGGAGTENVKFDAEYTIPVANYSFSGSDKAWYVDSWNTKADGTGVSYAADATVKNLISGEVLSKSAPEDRKITLYAQYKPGYMVNYQKLNADMDGFENYKIVGVPVSQKTDYDITKVEGVAIPGYEFVGWSDNATAAIAAAADGTETDIVKKIGVSNNVNDNKLYPVYKEASYTIKIDANGGTGRVASLTGIKLKNEEDDDTVIDLDAVAESIGGTRTGYKLVVDEEFTLNKFGTGKTFTGKPTFASIVDDLFEEGKKETTLYANWEGDPFVIRFDNNVESSSLSGVDNDDINITFGESKEIPLATREYENNVFVGWNTKADFSGDWYYAGDMFEMNKSNMEKAVGVAINDTNGKEPGEDGWTPTYDYVVTLYAKWSLGTEVRYHAEDENGDDKVIFRDVITSDAKLNSYKVGIPSSENIDNPSVPGKTFVGWFKSDGVKKYGQSTTVTSEKLEGPTDFYPVFKENAMTVSYDANAPEGEEAIGVMPDSVLTYLGTTTLSQIGYTVDGYTFVGWNTKADGSGDRYEDGADVSELMVDKEESTLKLYAQWAQPYYYVIDSAGVDEEEITVSYGTSAEEIIEKLNALVFIGLGESDKTQTIKEYYKENGYFDLTWDVRNKYDGKTSGTYSFEGTITFGDAVTNGNDEEPVGVYVDVVVSDQAPVKSISKLGTLTFDNGTSKEDIEKKVSEYIAGLEGAVVKDGDGNTYYVGFTVAEGNDLETVLASYDAASEAEQKFTVKYNVVEDETLNWSEFTGDKVTTLDIVVSAKTVNPEPTPVNPEPEVNPTPVNPEPEVNPTPGTDTTTGSSTDVTPSNGGGSGSGGGGGSSNAKTVKNADGSTTTTTTTAKGTIETTTKTNADGSKTTSKVVKNKDGSGSVTETSVSAAGTTKVVEVVTDTTGAATEVTTTVSNSKGASMKVTYAAKGTAITVSKVETTGKTAVSIPATVKVGGKTYKVTKIAASALKGNKEITKVTLGKNVKSIGKNAFNGDSKLKTIVMKKAPTTVGKNAFKGIAKKATIKIKATKKAFKTAKKLIKKSGIASTVKIKRTK